MSGSEIPILVTGLLRIIRHALGQIRKHANAVKQLHPLINSLQNMETTLSQHGVAGRLNRSLINELESTSCEVQSLTTKMEQRSMLGRLWNGSTDLEIADRLATKINTIYMQINTNLGIMMNSGLNQLREAHHHDQALLQKMKGMLETLLEQKSHKEVCCNHQEVKMI